MRRPDVTIIGATVGVLAVICCAGLPAIAAVLGGITIAGVLGVTGGLLALAALAGAALLAVRARRRRAVCQTPPPRTRA